MNHLVFDSILRLNNDIYLFQITVSKKHPIDGTHLREQVSRILELAPNSIIRLIFVVPLQTARRFRLQTIEPFVEGVSQYVLPLDHRAASLDRLSITQLRTFCRQLGIKSYSRLSRKQLTEEIAKASSQNLPLSDVRFQTISFVESLSN